MTYLYLSFKNGLDWLISILTFIVWTFFLLIIVVYTVSYASLVVFTVLFVVSSAFDIFMNISGVKGRSRKIKGSFEPLRHGPPPGFFLMMIMVTLTVKMCKMLQE